MKKHILDFKENECIHVPTLEEAEWLMKEFDELGLRWNGGKSCKLLHNWKTFGTQTVYYPNHYSGHMGSVAYAELSTVNEYNHIVFNLKDINAPQKLIRPLEALVEFQTAFKCPVNTEPTLLDKERAKLRYDLAKEELDEYMEAVENGDMVETLDALVDQFYILMGTVVESGLQDVFMKAFEAVHESNMSKLDENGQPIINGENGVYDETRPLGKVIKSRNYLPPNLKQFL